MKKKTLILFLIILDLVFVNAQTNTDSIKIAKKQARIIKKTERKSRNRYLLFNIGTGITKQKDQTVSPLLYKGNNFSFGLSYMRLDKRKINIYNLNFNTASLSLSNTDIYQGSNTSVYNFNLDIYSLYGITDIGTKLRFYLGWHLTNNFTMSYNAKYMNSAVVMGFFMENGITTRIDLPFSWKAKNSKFLFFKIKRKDRQLRASFMLSLPLFTNTLLRPEYAGITNFVDGKSNISTETKTCTYGKYFALNTKLELLYELGNYNLFKIAYNWNFLHYNPGYNKLQIANHYFLLSFVFKLNKLTKSINYRKEINNE